jgi:hypothetical protein
MGLRFYRLRALHGQCVCLIFGPRALHVLRSHVPSLSSWIRGRGQRQGLGSAECRRIQSIYATECRRTPQAHGGEPIIPFSGKLEAKIFDMPDDEREAFLTEVRKMWCVEYGM